MSKLSQKNSGRQKIQWLLKLSPKVQHRKAWSYSIRGFLDDVHFE